jgi:chitodextrinase
MARLSLGRIRNQSTIRLVTFIACFAIVGVALLVFAFAAPTSSVGGTIFEDTNKNGVLDSSEVKMSGHQLYLFDSNWRLVSSVVSDSAGLWKFSGLEDGDYLVTSVSTSWDPIANRLVPENSGSLRPEWKVHVAGETTQQLIWRPIIRSTTQGQPISSVTAPDGMKVESYVDVVTATEISQAVHNGLVGPEAAKTTIRFGLSESDISAISAGSDFYAANVYVSYLSWLKSEVPDNKLSHEYGHAWSLYHAYITQQDPTMTSYLRFRGLENNPKLNTSHAWNVTEMIAEDYRQLLGSTTAQASQQENTEIPYAKDVPGLKEFLRDTYTKSPSGGTATAINLSGAASGSNSVQLNWTVTGTSPIAQYEIYRNNIKVGFVNAPTTTYFDTLLTPNTSYSYFVKAKYTNGELSGASNTLSLVTPQADTSAPSAPSNLRTTSITSSNIGLAWNASTDNISVSNYRVYRLDRSKRVLISTLPGTTYNVTGLARNKSYTFIVTAIDSSGNESQPAQLTAKTLSR